MDQHKEEFVTMAQCESKHRWIVTIITPITIGVCGWGIAQVMAQDNKIAEQAKINAEQAVKIESQKDNYDRIYTRLTNIETLLRERK